MYTFERDELSDRMTVATNVANGKRMIKALDLSLAGRFFPRPDAKTAWLS
jgi:hypothetical protein